MCWANTPATMNQRGHGDWLWQQDFLQSSAIGHLWSFLFLQSSSCWRPRLAFTQLLVQSLRYLLPTATYGPLHCFTCSFNYRFISYFLTHSCRQRWVTYYYCESIQNSVHRELQHSIYCIQRLSLKKNHVRTLVILWCHNKTVSEEFFHLIGLSICCSYL